MTTTNVAPISFDFAEKLNEKFAADGYEFSVMNGRRFDRIVIENVRHGHNDHRSVFAFVERSTGDLYKAAGWNAPAKHKRYNGSELLNMAIEDADVYGSFLYMR